MTCFYFPSAARNVLRLGAVFVLGAITFGLTPSSASAQDATITQDMRHVTQVCVPALMNPKVHLKTIDAKALGYSQRKAAKRHAIFIKRANRKQRIISAARVSQKRGGDSCGITFYKTTFEQGAALTLAMKSVIKAEGYKEIPVSRDLDFKAYGKGRLSMFTNGKQTFVLKALHTDCTSGCFDNTSLSLRRVMR